MNDGLDPVRGMFPSASVVNGFFQMDIFPEKTSKENWSEYCDVQATLREIGFELEDPQVEHDCISGKIVAVPIEPNS